MRRYRTFFPGYWTSADIVDLPSDTKLLGAYLLTSPHANMIGCFRLPNAYVVDDLRMGSETVSKGFRNLCGNGFITHDSALSWVLINKFLKWNPIENPNQGIAASKLVAEVPQNSSVYAPLLDMLRLNPRNFPDGFVDGLGTVSKPFRNQEQEQEQEQKHEPEQNTLVQLASEIGRDRHGEIVENAFSLYCSLLKRDPRRYGLTQPRKAKAVARLKEREKINGSLELAESDLRAAIQNLAASNYHTAGGYIDWDAQIFRSREEFEKRFNWVAPKGAENAIDQGNKPGAVGRVERTLNHWDGAFAERLAVGALQKPVPTDAGLLPAPRICP